MDDNAWIQLNIGGKVFETTRKTLCRDPESFLARLDGDDSALPRRKDKKGAYVIDREPENFAVILHYLRTGFLKVPDGVTREELVEEAEFYNLVALVKLIEDTSFKKPSVEYFTVARYPQEHRVQLAMSESPKDCTSILSEIHSKGLDVREGDRRYYLV
ncbi:potassium channel tetramerization domain containing 5-like protein, partial [Aphelenchoides avenae]